MPELVLADPAERDDLGAFVARAVRLDAQAVVRLRRASLPDGDDLVARAFGSDDFHDAVRAFSAKERPVWRGR